MRRIAALLLFAVSLLLLGSVVAQEGRRPLPTAKVLTNRLPRGLEGVTVDKGAVRLKSGYKFIKKPGGGMAVARISGGSGGGLGTIGMFNCMCADGNAGPCLVVNTGTSLICMTMNPSQCGMCILQVTVYGATTKLMSFQSATEAGREPVRSESVKPPTRVTRPEAKATPGERPETGERRPDN